MLRAIVFILILQSVFIQCNSRSNKEQLNVVTYADFEKFVRETGYITDAERYTWSIVQQDVYRYSKVYGATWLKPDGVNTPTSKDLPVTQVSYNDAMAYCKWSNTRLPTYKEYWKLINNDQRVVVSNNQLPISSAKEVNILGNVWEITSSTNGKDIRLAGGSLFCSPNSCHGTVKQRSLYVDKQTGNIHIGFAVIKDN